MGRARAAIEEQYERALGDFLLRGPDDLLLDEACELGRACRAEHLGALDVATMHHRALLRASLDPPGAAAALNLAAIGDAFLARALAPLEQQLEDRTEELARTTEELEALSYSISHDLRAPLRAMGGLSRILLDDYGDQLPDEACRYLNMVHDNAQHMSQLMEELLALSRLNRQPLTKVRVDLGVTARHAMDGVRRETERERRIDLIVGDLPTCDGDPLLLRQMFTNLLDNAVKFTRPRDCARIEIGHGPVNGQLAYFVRDNGVGFDMRYADRLFGVFQRLHRAEEFEGNGIGLAATQRIVHRHGGRIWAEGQLGEGACFYFTIGAMPDER